MTARCDWRGAFPALARAEDPVVTDMLSAARCLTLPAGQVVFEPGSACEAYLMVLHGRVRVQMVTQQGREVLLYHVSPGQTCVLTTACLLGNSRYPAEGRTEEPVTALAVPQAGFRRAVDDSRLFRDFVFSHLSQRLADVLARMEEVAFGGIDQRLARALLDRLNGGDVVVVTHQALAGDLGTAREVVSRHLKRLEHSGLLALHRGQVRVLDVAGLRRLASG